LERCVANPLLPEELKESDATAWRKAS